LENKFEITEFIKKYYKLNRAPVCDDITYLIEKIKENLPDGKILKSKSGEECLTWITPPAWNVKSAVLKDSTNNIIIDFKDNPLHLIQYSSPFEGEVEFEELDKHLYYSKEHPDDIPFIYRKQYEYKLDDSWGISLPYNKYKNLQRTGKYFVKIDVEFVNKEMAVFDLHVPGEKKETIFFAAHSCHPAQVNDGIAGIALLIKLFKWIISLKKRRYSYRFIVGPEYFAASLFLKDPKRVKDLQFGFFLDMMVHSGPIEYSSSFDGNSMADYIIEHCVKKQFSKFEKYEYRGIWGNDELFYDGPDFKIPTIGLGRSNFDNYHFSSDDLNTIDNKSVEESMTLLENIVSIFENDRILKRKYHGPLYLNRYELYLDAKKERQGYRNLQDIQILMDGTKSTLEIAKELKIEPDFVNKFADSLLEKKLAEEVSIK